MERYNLAIGLLILLMLNNSGNMRLLAQSSPTPVLLNYAATSLPDTLAQDSAFCKGRTLTINGQYFQRTQGGETWDTTRIFFGGFAGVPGNVLRMSSAQNGQNDSIWVQIPDVFIEDTCLVLTIVKSTSQGSFPFTYSVSDTICLIGDYANITYPDTLFCIGEPNPLPQIVLSSTTTGAFCCVAGPSGFIVLANGEVPLYNGSAGVDNTFEYRTTDPFCPDTIHLRFDILPMTSSVALYNGQNSLTLCSASASYPVADSATLVPGLGWGHFADPTGNVLVLDSLTGMLNPAGCQPGTHDLLYIPHLPCYDTAVVSVTVNVPGTAQVIYPGITSQPPQICQSDPIQNPAFIAGSPGGNWWSVPPGVSFGQLGEIIPAQCQAGIYNIFYRPMGNCVDTVQVLSGLVIDSASTSNLGYTSLSLCASDTLSFGLLAPGWCGVFLGGNTLYSGPNAVLPLSGPNGLGLQGNEILNVAYSEALACSDTAWAPVSVLPAENASFSYPNPAYCLGDPDPFPVIAGNGGGTFSAITTATVLDPTTGQLDLAASGQGQHCIVYTTSGPCPSSDTTFLFIYNAASAQFSFSASVFCQGEADPIANITGAPGGLFSSDSGLVVHPDSGIIFISQSQPGTYNVTYSLSGGCNTSFSQTVQIVPFDSSSGFSYATEMFCRDGLDPVPAIFGDSVGTFYGSNGLVFSNRDSGMVDLDLSGPGTFVVTFDLENRCALDPTDTIQIHDTDNAFFSYSSAEVCAGGAPFTVDSLFLSGGTFTCASSDLVFADSLGTVDLVRSLPGGPYAVVHTSNGQCPAQFSQSLVILPRPEGVSLQGYPEGTICEGEQVIFRAEAIGATSFDWFLNGEERHGAFDLLQIDSLQDGDSVVCVLANAFGCADTLAAVAEIAAVPRVAVLKRPFKLRRGEPIIVELGSNVAGTVYDWRVIGRQNVQILRDSGRTVDLNPGESVSLEIPVGLERREHPGFVEVVIAPRAGDCVGPVDTLQVEILPADFPIFVPEVITPNGDGLNDVWHITWEEGIDPNDYEVRLYNRAGGMVARIAPLRSDWEPGSLVDGVYWWVLSRFHTSEGLLSGGLKIARK